MRTSQGRHRRPIIAVTPDLAAPDTGSAFPRYELRAAYAQAIVRAGVLPIILPYLDDEASIDQALDRVGGLVVSGGAFDIPPQRYGEEPQDGLGPVKPERTTFELALLQAGRRRRLPVLGICGGMQLVNVALGGTLVQDISRQLPAAKPHEQKHDRTQPQHPVEVKDGSLLARCVGRGQLMVNSTHHQAVKAVGQGLVASAVAPDGVVEAVEGGDGEWLVGVQWHPELLWDSVPAHQGLFRALVAKARERRT